MNDDKLIELVRSYPVLYDQSNPKYMDTNLRNGIWKQIGKEMGTSSGPSCKNRWANIRDNFRKSLKKTTTTCGQTVKKYKYSEQLSFLTNFFREKENKGNASDEDRSQDLTDEDDESLVHGYYQNPQELAAVVINPNTRLSQSHSSSAPKEIDALEYPSQPKKPKQSQLKSNPPQTASDTLVDKKESTPSPSPDEVDAFLSGIAPSLKKLPPHYWHYAKSEIFASVQKFEHKMIMEQSPFLETFRSSCHHSSNSEQPSPTEP